MGISRWSFRIPASSHGAGSHISTRIWRAAGDIIIAIPFEADVLGPQDILLAPSLGTILVSATTVGATIST